MWVVTMTGKVSVLNLFLSTMPNDIRGTMMGVVSLLDQIGDLIVTKSAISLTSNYGAKGPFGYGVVANFIIFVVGVFLACFGYLRIKKKIKLEVRKSYSSSVISGLFFP